MTALDALAIFAAILILYGGVAAAGEAQSGLVAAVALALAITISFWLFSLVVV